MVNLLKKLFFIICLNFTIEGAILKEIDTSTPMQCYFSNQHYNRIMVENDGIKKIIFQEENLTVHLEELSGQAFIYATRPIEKTLTLAVITNSGQVQDIEAQFKNLPSQIVILREPCPKEEKTIPLPCHVSEIPDEQCRARVIKEIMAGNLPEGYRLLPVESVYKKIKWGIKARALVHFDGAMDDIYVYEVLNISSKKRSLHEKDFCFPNSYSIFFNCHSLKPKEKASVIIFCRKQ